MFRSLFRTAVFGLIASNVFVASAAAAPLWLERKFIPAPALKAPVFAKAAETQSAAIDYTSWAQFLSRYLVEAEEGPNLVRYGAITPEDAASLDAFIADLSQVDVAALTKAQQLGYWINLYNAATVRLVAQAYPVDSIRKIKVEGEGPWDHVVTTVAGTALTLGDIEHHIIRAIFPDPRIHYALNCASIGCPELAPVPYTAETLEPMLTSAARTYINSPRGVTVERGKATISKIYGWYREDFGDDKDDVLAHLRTYADEPLKTELEDARIKRHVYDWALNGAE